uniref:Uncharacterized protein n=1 Tax=Siphoviridae sp. ctzjp2 TaxID=2826532 RepID=A0A8S5QMC1_9CAUD|nr:MAG TPA: hypothetical protein [Siphoviridae sp. ctzjp2]
MNFSTFELFNLRKVSKLKLSYPQLLLITLFQSD